MRNRWKTTQIVAHNHFNYEGASVTSEYWKEGRKEISLGHIKSLNGKALVLMRWPPTQEGHAKL